MVLRLEADIAALRFAPDELAFAEAADARGDRNGRLSLDELHGLADARRFPLGAGLRAESKLTAGLAPVADYKRRLAAELVRPAGTATAEDIEVVVAELARLPVRYLELMRRTRLVVQVCRGSVAEVPQTGGPRGQSDGSTWRDIMGVATGQTATVATSAGTGGRRLLPPKGQGHGVYSLVLHEVFHLLDAAYVGEVAVSCPAPSYHHSGAAAPATSSPSTATPVPGAAGGNLSSFAPAFVEAWKADFSRLGAYYQQPDGAGQEEAFAESAARYFGGDPTLESDWPALYAFWHADPFTDRALRTRVLKQRCNSF
jgi:hypothetical protein